MCGIAGAFRYGGQVPPIDPDAIGRMCTRMHARGPDAGGYWSSHDGNVHFGHRRLAIIDLSDAGAQPMSDSDTGNVIVFNGEIYNFRELRAGLEQRGHRFRSHSDTEVLLKMYAHYGTQMVQYLRGMFAFALWDMNQQTLFLARDPFGIKPLYVADTATTLYFASQVKALLAAGVTDTRSEPAGHVGFFLWGHVPDPFTLYAGIRAVRAGTWEVYTRDGQKQLETYFEPAEHLCELSQTIPNKNDLQEEVRAALLDSVQHHLIADVPVGAFLSSGRDSATLVGLASELGMSNLQTLTLGFSEYRGTANDETSLARTVANQYGTDHCEEWIDASKFHDELAFLFDVMDQPSIDGVNTYFVCRAAQKRGLKVALSGLGGDELFAGYQDFRQIPALVSNLQIARPLSGLGPLLRTLSSPFVKQLTSPKYAGLLEYGTTYVGAYLLSRTLHMPWELYSLMDKEMVQQGLEKLDTQTELERTIKGVDDPRLIVHLLTTAWYMGNQLLRDTDWASMAHSLEVRVPLVDIEMWRTVNRLVMSGRIPNKDVMAQCVRPCLPREFVTRAKTGFSVPISRWISAPNSKSDYRKLGLRGWAKMLYQAQGFAYK